MSQGIIKPFLSNRKVLMAVDGKLLRELLVTLLKQAGADRFLFGNGVEMLRAVRDFAPDIIFCEMQMPVLGGLDFARQLRNAYMMKTPLVMLVPRTDADAAGQAAKAGASASLPVPFTAKELTDTTRKLLDGGHQDKPGKIDWSRYS
jgi:CheY-like chemotaxis protein